nr:hypothetical protein [Tanacetum cinerariifolium]
MRVRLWTQQRHESPCASSKFQGMGCPMMGGESNGALGALGDDSLSVGDGVFASSCVKSTNNCFGGMMFIFGLLEALEVEALVDAMDVDNG